MIRFWSIFLSVFVLAGPHARAQVVTMATPIGAPFRTSQSHDQLASLTSEYNAGDWPALQRRGRALIAAIAESAAAGEIKEALDLRRNYVALTWIGTDPFGSTQLIRFVAHDPAPDLFSLDLPGVSDASAGGALYELVLTRTAAGGAASAYASTGEADPVAAALPDVIRTLAGPLFGAISAVAGPLALAEPEPRLFATVKRVGLPFRRARVKLTAVAVDPWFDEPTFTGGLAGLTASVRFEDVPASACARDHARKVGEALRQAPAACSDQELGRCQSQFDERLAKLYEAALSACDGGKPPAAEVRALQLVDERFREYVAASLTNSAELQQTFDNRPLTRFAFGAGTGVMVRARLTDPRVDLDRGVLVADPLPRVMTMAFVNWSPAGYRADAPAVSAAERFRVQIGAALTPDFGVMLGGNVLLARGIGVSGGVAVLFAKGARQEEIGAAPVDATDAYRLSIATAPYVGITYNYK